MSAYAEADLKVAANWYVARKEGLDRDFITEIEKTMQRIQNNPLQFACVRKQIRMSIVKRFPYGIYFYVIGDVINIFSVFHFSRNPKAMRKRIKPTFKKK